MAKRSYTDDERQQILAVYRSKGLTACNRDTGVSKETILRWAREEGVEPPNPNAIRAANGRKGGIEAAKRAKEVVMGKLQERAERTLDVHAIALARELQVLGSLQDPSVADLRHLTQVRTTAVRDLELILRRIGDPEKESEGAEMLELVKHCFAQALNDAKVPVEQQEHVRVAFAHRLRVAAAGGEAMRYDTTPDDEDDDLVIAGELEAAEHAEGM